MTMIVAADALSSPATAAGQGIRKVMHARRSAAGKSAAEKGAVARPGADTTTKTIAEVVAGVTAAGLVIPRVTRRPPSAAGKSAAARAGGEAAVRPATAMMTRMIVVVPAVMAAGLATLRVIQKPPSAAGNPAAVPAMMTTTAAGVRVAGS
jgi:hypothetical protein